MDRAADGRLAVYGTLAPGYRRVPTPVRTAGGDVDAWIDVLAG